MTVRPTARAITRSLIALPLVAAAGSASALGVTLEHIAGPADGGPWFVANIAADGHIVGSNILAGNVYVWTHASSPPSDIGGDTFTLTNVLPLISRDGSTIVAGFVADETAAIPRRWSGSDWLALGGQTIAFATPFAVSADGQRVAGAGSNPPPEGEIAPIVPWRWSAAGGMAALPLIGDSIHGEAWAISVDGTIAAGFVEPGPDHGLPYGVRWLDGVASWIVDANAARVGQAMGCNSDCSIIIGAGVSVPQGNESARGWMYTQANGVQYLPPVPGASADAQYYPFDLAEDGSVVVGSYVTFDPELGPMNRAFLWTAADGTRDVTAFLATHGYAYGEGWNELVASSITPDGRHVLLFGFDADFARHGAVIHLDPSVLFANGFEE